MGNNRQTLLLSDSGYDCENKTGEQMLEEAKKNLQSMAFFGLTEYQNYTQKLFLKIFSKNFKLAEEFAQSNRTFAETFINKQNDTVQIPYLEEIKRLNKLDIELYSFAKELFFKRLKDFRIV
ncbi:heparan-sulfate 6-O-sulfotransferase 1 [Brachionus plicatilis]|uniref:Heparan-sulfate 6-O-sulfotransferase n=1 Tax=Brachionus plicatilis TaxID=10195 RepID=A0A3M7P6M8_BRAPC|nr:heparan-sulfate 6-O-sulfotransferase 1 [Brachionus plicatilis]